MAHLNGSVGASLEGRSCLASRTETDACSTTAAHSSHFMLEVYVSRVFSKVGKEKRTLSFLRRTVINLEGFVTRLSLQYRGDRNHRCDN